MSLFTTLDSKIDSLLGKSILERKYSSIEDEPIYLNPYYDEFLKATRYGYARAIIDSKGHLYLWAESRESSSTHNEVCSILDLNKYNVCKFYIKYNREDRENNKLPTIITQNELDISEIKTNKYLNSMLYNEYNIV